MAKGYSERLEKLMKGLSRLPGIGPKSAERIALFLMKQTKAEVDEFAESLKDAKANTLFCAECNNLSEDRLCHICSDPSRDRTSLCIVEEPKDVILIEKSGAHHGLYHVLLGALSPLDGIGPRELRLDRLLKRVNENDIREVILATNPNAEGDATALYISEILKPKHVKITRIARGVPVGSSIEYVDQATLQRALEGRTAV